MSMSQTIVLKVKSNLEWKDPRLAASSRILSYVMRRIDPKFYGCFWRPYMRIANLAGEDQLEKVQVMFLLDKTGTMRLLRHHKFLVQCPMDLSWYPMDVQTCWIGFVSWSYDGIILNWAKEHLFNFTTRHESAYDVTISGEENCEWHAKQLSCLYLKLIFKRRLGMFLTIYFPSSLVVIVSFISFWIDPLSVPGRVTLTVTSLLALLTQFISVRDPLSDVNHVTAIDVWFIGCILSVALTMFEFALYHFLQFRLTKYSRVQTIKNQINVFDALAARFSRRERNIFAKMRNVIRTTNYDLIARTVFPTLFFTYSVLYWVTLMTYSG